MSSRSLIRTVATSMVGNMFEWYDFALFGYFAPIIGKLFFPADHHIIQLLSAFAAFAVGYIFRPFGGAFFGYIGDKYGRKNALILTIFFMAIPTTLIGLLPTYQDWGFYAPCCLVILRIFQGMSMGGNYGGSITFTTEHAALKQKGLVGSFAVTSCLFGLMLGSATAALCANVFDERTLHAWGWRMPFIIGISICLVGFYMKKRLHESADFDEAKKTGDTVKNPPITVFKEHGKMLFLVVGAVMLHDLSFYILFVYMTTYLTEVVGMAKNISFTVNTINLLVVSLATLGAAWLSDVIGRMKVLKIAAVLFIIGTIPLMMVINQSGGSMGIVMMAQMILAIAVGGYFGPLPALMVEAYPTNVRFSAVSITTNISGPLFGGTAPMLMTYLIHTTGSSLIPAFYLTLGAIGSLAALRALQNRVITNAVKGS